MLSHDVVGNFFNPKFLSIQYCLVSTFRIMPNNTQMLPGRALDLFVDPPMQMLWDEKPLWTASKMFLDGDETSKALLTDMRSSLQTSKVAAFSTQLLPSAKPLNECLSQMPTVQKVAFKCVKIGCLF
jgi:hypothetical protein